MILVNSCKYSFKDLLYAAKLLEGSEEIDKYLKNLYSMSQKDRNIEVKKLCKKSMWYFNDVIGKDGIVYTSFSPNINRF